MGIIRTSFIGMFFMCSSWVDDWDLDIISLLVSCVKLLNFWTTKGHVCEIRLNSALLKDPHALLHKRFTHPFALDEIRF
jgi:hypothetical protein